MPAPTDLEDLGYGRGKLRPGPAASVRRLDVILGRPLDINSAYRDYAEQMRKYLAYVAYQNGRGPWAPLALHPDESWHCKGMAIDTDDRLAVFGEHGWRFEVRGEPWHGQYYTSLDKHYGETASGNVKPLPTPGEPDEEGEEDMARLLTIGVAVAGGGQQYWSVNVDTNQAWLIQNGSQLEFRRALGIPEHLNQAEAVLAGYEKSTG